MFVYSYCGFLLVLRLILDIYEGVFLVIGEFWISSFVRFLVVIRGCLDYILSYRFLEIYVVFENFFLILLGEVVYSICFKIF